MSLRKQCCKVIKFPFGNSSMNTNNRYTFSNQRVSNPQFLHNFSHSRFWNQQNLFYPPQLQNFPYHHCQYNPYTPSGSHNQQRMSGADRRNEAQPNRVVFWDKIRDIKKRTGDVNSTQVHEVENKKMRNSKDQHQSSTNHRVASYEKDPADSYKSRPKLKKTNYGRTLGGRNDGHLFSICSYNILAQNLLEMHPDLYYHCTREYLFWEYRKRNILNELQKSETDIMCLQEVEEDKFFQVFQPELRRLGFSGVFKKRTGEKRDGCAIFYRDRCFQLEKCCSVEYYQPEVHILDRDNIGLIVILKSKLVPSKLCIANTHLLFNPKRGDVKLAQLSKLFAEIDKVSYETTGTGGRHCPIILCGDFNSEPNSPLYSFIVNAFLDYSYMFSGDVCRPLGSSNPQKRGFELRVPLLPKKLGITRSCQYVDVLEQRSGLQERSTDGEVKCEDERGKNKESEAKMQLNHPVSSSEPPQQIRDKLSSLMNASRNNDALTKTSGNAGASGSSSTVAREARAAETASASSTPSSSVEQTQGSSKTQHNPPKHHLHHNLDIESSYQLQDGLTTTHHCKTNCVVDFMFNSRPRKNANISDLKRVAWLPLFTDFESNEMGGLPNKHWSSDHYRLQVKFMLRPPSTKP